MTDRLFRCSEGQSQRREGTLAATRTALIGSSFSTIGDRVAEPNEISESGSDSRRRPHGGRWAWLSAGASVRRRGRTIGHDDQVKGF